MVTPKEAHSFSTTQHWLPINKHQIVPFVCVGTGTLAEEEDEPIQGPSTILSHHHHLILLYHPPPVTRYSANGHHSIHPVQPD